MEDNLAKIGDSAIVEPQRKRKRLIDVLFKRASGRQFSIFVPHLGDIVEGKVLKKHGSKVYIDLGFGTGVIYGQEYQEGKDVLKQKDAGDIVVSKVVELEDEDGFVELSVKEAGKEKFWKDVLSMLSSKEPVSLKALDANKGGLIFEWKGVKGFLPVSQLSVKHYPRVEGGDKDRILDELRKFIGQEFSLTIITADSNEEKLIFSERMSDPEQLKEIMAKYKVGDVYEGEVTGVVEFGVFVKLEEGLEGLVHISEIDWSLVENPEDTHKIGEHVKVKVIGIEGDKISLSIKALKPDPWKELKIEKGDIVEGTITRFNKYGAFVQLFGGSLYGLAHISEFGSVQKMKETIEIGETYPFQIVVFQPDNHKLSLAFLGNEEKNVTVKAPAEAKEEAAEVKTEERTKDKTEDETEMKAEKKEDVEKEKEEGIEIEENGEEKAEPKV